MSYLSSKRLEDQAKEMLRDANVSTKDDEKISEIAESFQYLLSNCDNALRLDQEVVDLECEIADLI